ncbi:protein ANTAGONIST OF LIKE HETEROCHROMATIN PROTEIN 1-like [Ixodes scapularis]|uniref:protein ANTAGONIST OF LIKE HETEROCHROMATIN PROTEIN 1-like n=1 Tax=Ixodes scapularis TaxID=6945 RepID=UPI0011255637|nr:protein ANTAGONIST OF LIKE HETEROCHROMATIN PROTEIN 1-like [Ixodes scapularis]
MSAATHQFGTPRPLLISNTSDLRAVVGCQMLLLHALRKRRRRLLLDQRPSHSVHMVQNAMLLRRVQRRQSRIHFLANLVKTAVTAGLGRDLCLDRKPSDNHVSAYDDSESDLDDDDHLLSPGQISDDVWLNTFRVGKDLYHYLLTELKPFMCVDEDDRDDDYPPFEQRVSIALWRLGKVWDDPALMRAFGVTGDTVARIVREFCAAVVKVLMPRFVQVPYDEDLEDIAEQFRDRTKFPRCAGALCFAHVPILPPQDDEGNDYTNPEGWNSIVVQAVVGADRRFWDLNIGWPGSTQVAQVLRSSSLWKKGEEGTLFAAKVEEICGIRVKQVLAAGTGYPLRRWIVTPYLMPNECQLRFNRSLSEVLSVGEAAFRRLEARFPFLLRHNGSGIDLMPSIVAACSTLHNMTEEWGDGFAEFWLAEASRHALPQPHPGGDPAGDAARSAEGEAIRAALFAAVIT